MNNVIFGVLALIVVGVLVFVLGPSVFSLP